jgi:hypothetical protein
LAKYLSALSSPSTCTYNSNTFVNLHPFHSSLLSVPSHP